MIGDFPQPLPLRIIPPQSRNAMGTQMSTFDWRSQDAYDRAQEAEITGFAWECLRRNPGFQHDRQSASPASLTVSAEFRHRWGLVFRS
ncbi:transcriptional regulator domain-containing protein [Bradyrhizobium lablabi]|uniref:transcriptional regulator domain-containing protein n=1 Tax=Bradyrhizobium lablabi TaxID=722472 RepID=UPI0032E4E29C